MGIRASVRPLCQFSLWRIYELLFKIYSLGLVDGYFYWIEVS